MELLRPQAGSKSTQRAAKPLQPLLQWLWLSTQTGHWFLSSGSLNPCCLNCSSGHSLTPNSLCLREDRRGCGFLFSLGLFTDFTGSDYGALLYRLKPAPLKAVTTGKDGEGAEGSSEEPSSNLVPRFGSSRCALPGLHHWGCVPSALPVALHRLQGRKESSRKTSP